MRTCISFMCGWTQLLLSEQKHANSCASHHSIDPPDANILGQLAHVRIWEEESMATVAQSAPSSTMRSPMPCALLGGLLAFAQFPADDDAGISVHWTQAENGERDNWEINLC